MKCACGQDLHYSSEGVRQWMDGVVSRRGETVKVSTPLGSWHVPRHYIALHGLKAEELPKLAKVLSFQEAQ